MSAGNYGFYFERAGRAASQGAIAPAEQFFEGAIAEISLARETGQNSIDARASDAPVEMTFELADVPTDQIPGISDLRVHLAQVEEATRDSQGHERMATALTTALEASVPVLRIGDSGTTGLLGSESSDAPTSALSALTRGAGISADDGSRGGSFGIGSAVGPMASAMCTVLYTSLPVGDPAIVFAGYSRLASHKDLSGQWRMGDGFFTDLDVEDDFSYLRNPPALGPFSTRTVPGTDVFVLGYRKAEADPELHHIRDAFVTHFLMAIHRGHLVVNGVTPSGSWRLDKETLPQHVESVPEAAAFYRAIHDPSPIVRVSDRFGELTLYIDVDDSLDRTLHTIAMRTPLMKIDTFKHTSIPAKYAAVLVCAEQKGNLLLRKLEPPQHDKWDHARASGGYSALKELKDFVREGLKSRVKDQIGDQVEIKGLAKYLPAETFLNENAAATDGRVPADGPGTAEESSTVQGDDRSSTERSKPKRRSIPVRVRTSASSEGEDTTSKGRDTGGNGTRASKGTGLPGKGGPGDDSSRINANEVRFKSWTDAATGALRVAVTSPVDVIGDLELVPIGQGGSVEDNYRLPIGSVELLSSSESDVIEHDGNTLRSVSLQAGVTLQLRVDLGAGHRYRLGIK